MPVLTHLSWQDLYEKKDTSSSLSPDTDPSYFYLFKGLQNHLDGLKLTSREEVKHELVPYFALKHKEFYKQGIYKPADKLNGVLGSNGSYVNDSIYLLP